MSEYRTALFSACVQFNRFMFRKQYGTYGQLHLRYFCLKAAMNS